MAKVYMGEEGYLRGGGKAGPQKTLHNETALLGVSAVASTTTVRPFSDLKLVHLRLDCGHVWNMTSWCISALSNAQIRISSWDIA